MLLASERREYQYILKKSREAMVLIFNSTISREVSGTNFTPTLAITYTYMYGGT